MQTLGDTHTSATGDESKSRWPLRVTLLSFAAFLVWGYLAYRLWLAEPLLSVRVLFILATITAVSILIRQCFFIRRTSLKVLVVGAPILIAIVSLPARQVVSHWQLRKKLAAAGVNDFALGTSDRFDTWMHSAASALLGESYAQSFNTDLTIARIQLELADPELITQLPSEHLALVTIRRTEESAALVDSKLVDWLNSIPGNPLVSLRLQSPESGELLALRELKQLTMLKLSRVALRDLVLDLPSVYDLAFESSNLATPFDVQHVHLPKLERFTVEDTAFQLSPQFISGLEKTQYVTFTGCTLDPVSFESICRLPASQLTINRMSFPEELAIPLADNALGRSLTTWDSHVRPSQLIEILRMRHSRVALIRVDAPFSPEEFASLISLPSLRSLRIQSPWLTKAHLLGLTHMTKQFRLNILDSTIPEQDVMWLQENKPDSVHLYLQSALPSENEPRQSPSFQEGRAVSSGRS